MLKNDFHFRGSVQDSKVGDLILICAPVSARPVTDISISLGLHLLAPQKDNLYWRCCTCMTARIHLSSNSGEGTRNGRITDSSLKGTITDLTSLKFAVVTKPSESTVRYRTSFSSSGVTNSEVTQGDAL
jgi:hypothetical protein